MFWWRKRNEGFEWRDYVRTTILVRREQRRQRLKEAQAAAVAQVKDAGRRGVGAGLEGARVVGRGAWSHFKSSGLALLRGMGRGAAWLGSAAIATAGGIAALATGVGRRVGSPAGQRLEPLLSQLRRSRLSLVLKVVLAAAALGALYRWYNFGADGDVIFVAAIAVVALVLLVLAAATDPERPASRPTPHARRDSLLSRLNGGDFALPDQGGFSPSQIAPALLAFAAVVGGGAALFYGVPYVAGFVSSGPTVTEPKQADTGSGSGNLEGRATALSGDRLRVAGRRMVLDGIEAPEAGQTCERKTGKWRCGAAARDALASIVRGRRVNCDILGEDEEETRARCYVRGADIAEALVRNGHVFAVGGFMSAYAGAESTAQDEQRGLWAGAVERPQDYRDKRWEQAKKSAPDGCPIKGRVRAGARIYVLPWSPSYDSIRLSAARGERWFCSESEAQAAGWTRSSAS